MKWWLTAIAAAATHFVWISKRKFWIFQSSIWGGQIWMRENSFVEFVSNGVREAIIDLNRHPRIFNCLCITLSETSKLFRKELPMHIAHTLTATIYPRHQTEQQQKFIFGCYFLSAVLFYCFVFCVYGKLALPMFKGKNQSSKLLSCLSSSYYWGKQPNTPTQRKAIQKKYRQRRAERERERDRGMPKQRDRQLTKAMKASTPLFFHTHFRRFRLLLLYCCCAICRTLAVAIIKLYIQMY